VQVHSDGCRRQSRPVRDLLAVHPLDEAKYERLSIRLRQRSDHVEDRQGLGVVRGARDDLLGQRYLSERLTPVMVGDAMAGDGSEPAGKRRGLAQRLETAQGDEKDVLDRSSTSVRGTEASSRPWTIRA
jgi:hypothetical protein